MTESNFILFNTPAFKPMINSHRENRRQSFEREEQNILFRYKLERKPIPASKPLPKTNEAAKTFRRPVSSDKTTPRSVPIWINIPGTSLIDSQRNKQGKKLTSITPRKELVEPKKLVSKATAMTPRRTEKIDAANNEVSSARETGSENQFAHYLQGLINKLKSEKASSQGVNEDKSTVIPSTQRFKNPGLNRSIGGMDYETITPRSHRPTPNTYLQLEKLAQTRTPEFNNFSLNSSLVGDEQKEKQIAPRRPTPRADCSNQEQLWANKIIQHSRKYKSLNNSMEDISSFGTQRGSEQAVGNSKEFRKDAFKQLDLSSDQQRVTIYVNKPSTANGRFRRSNGFYNYKLGEEKLAEANEKRLSGQVDYTLEKIDPPNEQELSFLEKAFKFYNHKFYNSQKAKQYLKGSLALKEELHSMIESETSRVKQKMNEITVARRPVSRQLAPK